MESPLATETPGRYSLVDQLPRQPVAPRSKTPGARQVERPMPRPLWATVSPTEEVRAPKAGMAKEAKAHPPARAARTPEIVATEAARRLT